MLKRTARYVLYALGVGMVTLILGVIAVRIWTPDLAEHKARIENYLSTQAKRPVQIAHLVAEWDGWSPILRASGLRIRSRDGTFSALRLDEFIVQVNPWHLILGTLTFERFVVNRPALDVIRRRDGKFQIGDIAAGGRGDGGSGLVAWLFRQGEVRVTDGVLAWLDDASGARVMELGGINLVFRTEGDRHLISGGAQCRDAVCGGIRIEGTLVGDPPADAELQGSVRADVRALQAGRLLSALVDTGAMTMRGSGDVAVTGEFTAGRLASLGVDVRAPDLHLVRDGHVFPGFSGRGQWQHIDPTRWRMTFEDAVLHTPDDELPLEGLRVDRTESVTTVTLDGLDIAAIAPHVRVWVETAWRDTAAALRPRGRLHDLALRVTDRDFPADWRFQAGVDAVGWQPTARIPGVSKLSGQLLVKADGGTLDVDTQYTTVTWPEQLEEALGWAQVSGRANWTRRDGQWAIEAENLRLVNQDLALNEGRFQISMPADRAGPVVTAHARLERASVAKVRRYVPQRASPKLKKWLANALVHGEVSDGTVSFNGPVKAFPFRDGGGSFEAVARVAGGELAFHEKWPPLKNVTSEVRFHNQSLTVTGDAGRLMQSDLTRARVTIADLYTKTRTVEISGVLAAPVADLIEFLRRGPLIKRPIDLDVAGDGTGTLELDMTLPLKALKQTRVAGRYQTSGSTVTIAKHVTLSELTGSVEFTESTVQAEDLRAQLLGGAVALSVETVEPGQPPVFAVAGHGRGEVGRLAPILGEGLFDHVDGWAEWSGRLLVRRGQARLDVTSDLTGIGVAVPPPLGKPAYVARALSTRVEFLGNQGQRVGVTYGEGLNGVLQLAKRAGRWQVTHGEFRLGTGRAELPEQAGLGIVVTPDVFDADPWLEWVRAQPARAAGSEPTFLDRLRRFELEVGLLRMFGRDLGTMSLRARSQDGAAWVADLTGTAGHGTVEANIKSTPRRYALRMETLHWPRAEGGGRAADTDPATFPSVAIDAEQFSFGAMRLGRLRLRAAPVPNGWRISELTAEQPAIKIAAAGDWQRHGPDQRTQIQATVDSTDLGEALQALGFGGQIADGDAHLKGEFHWDGGATAFKYEKLGGSLELVAKNGRFLKVDPGTGRILGLVNLEALTRRLALDFSDLFATGLAFDRIEGTGEIESGDLTSEGFLIIGPAVLIEAEGRVGLADEDYDLELVVAPQVGDLGVLGALLANPAAGALLFVTNKLFKKQLAKVVHTRYRVTGPWTAPEIGRAAAPPVVAEEEGGVGVIEEREDD